MANFFSFSHTLRRIFGSTTTSRRRFKAKGANRLTLERLEPRLAPATTLSIANSSVLEPSPGGTVNMDFTVTRTGDVTSQLTVGYTTVAGTAQANTDFTPTTGTTTFASGSATATIAIPVFGNGVYNSHNLTFSVQLTGIVNIVGPPVTLANPSILSAGTEPISVAIGDFNGDGKPDLVVSNYGDGNVTVLLNTTAPGSTSPSFAAGQTFATGNGPDVVVVGDLNGDGKPDIVTANLADNTVSVLLNATTPGATVPAFAAHQDFAVGTGPESVAIGDFNGDGRPDIVAANYSDNSVSVLLNTTTPGATTASFATQQTFGVGNEPFSVAAGDLNGDGKADIVTANYTSNTVSVLLNTTTPGSSTVSFAAKQDITVGTGPAGVVIGDLNGDGKPDLAVANYLGNTVSVLLNTTTPGSSTVTFAPQQVLATGTAPHTLALGDLNGDSKPDLVVADIQSPSTVSVLLNTTAPGAATATFAPQQTVTTGGSEPISVAIGDLNGDGVPDLAILNDGSDNLSVLLNTTVLGTATITPDFPNAATVSAPTLPDSVAIADLNGDGKPDVIVANNTSGATGTVTVFMNTTPAGSSSPTFAAPVSFAVNDQPEGLAIADLNGDGLLDVVVVNYQSDNLSVLLNTTTLGSTSASFAAQQVFSTGTHPLFVAVGDLNGDGLPDLVTANFGSNDISVFLNTTTPGASSVSFDTPQDFAVGTEPRSVAIGDLNGDGLPDLAVANAGSSSVSVFLNETTPGSSSVTFATRQDFTVASRPESVAIADFNGDGLPDLVTAGGAFSNVSVLLNTTTPGSTSVSFATHQDFAVGAGPTFVAALDLNGDGKPDLAVANDSANTVSVLLDTTTPGSSTVSFTTHQDFSTGNTPFALATGDLNGDFLPDLVTTDDSAGTVSVLLNTPVTISNASATGTITESDLPPTAQFVLGSESISAAGGTFNLMVTLSDAADTSVSIPFTLSGTAVSGTDYSGVTVSPLVVPAGSTSIAISGSLLVAGPANATKTLTVTLGTPSIGSLGTPSANTLTIVEPPPTVQFSTGSESVKESAGTFSITVALSGISSTNTTIPFTLGGTAVAGTNYSGVTASPLVIPAGSTSATITGNLIDDGEFDTVNKTLTVTLGTPTNATLGASTTNTLTITESDSPPTVELGAETQTGATWTIPVTLSDASRVDTTIPFSLSGTAGVSSVTMSPLVIPAGSTSIAISGTFTDGGYGGSTKTVAVTLQTPTNGSLGTPSTLTFTESSLSISGTVFFDYNSNGVQDSGDNGLSGQTVYLDLKNDGTFDTGDPSAVTNANGTFTISNVPSGTYTLRQEVIYDNVTLTAGAANGLQVKVGTTAVTGVNVGEVLLSPIAPVEVNASIFGTSNPDANTAYVRGLYQTVLGRTASDSEVQYWLNALSNGVTREQVAQGFIQSVEHRRLEVNDYYQSFLHRTESATEQEYWVNVFLGGADETTVVEGFLTSAEYQGTHASNSLFAQDLYVDLLGRQGSDSELTTVENQLSAGTTRAQMVEMFLQSPEASTDAVQGFYATYLHRSASADAGSTYWVNLLSSGTSLGTVQADILGDPGVGEFFKDGAATV